MPKAFDTFKRKQIEWALWLLFNKGNGGAEIPQGAPHPH
jgi:hypothetical protein